ncbi:cystathionine beta-lyase, chloroplastic-like [Mangifera indica]|uniref:cystathionine beta-lyase, chloroplastic-like n=1 Tax=Mangifera indica TaxID=29780 RepID=UPI001CF9358C|nr:cystathionine beta-lyase, chloroplastic-like [Mangifera indica]
MDKADRAFCFASGMAALAAVTHLVGTGQEIVAGDDFYRGSDRLLTQVAPKSGIIVKRINTSDLDEVASSAIGPWAKLVWLESPTNPRQQISDIRWITALCLLYCHSPWNLEQLGKGLVFPVKCRRLCISSI